MNVTVRTFNMHKQESLRERNGVPPRSVLARRAFLLPVSIRAIMLFGLDRKKDNFLFIINSNIVCIMRRLVCIMENAIFIKITVVRTSSTVKKTLAVAVRLLQEDEEL